MTLFFGKMMSLPLIAGIVLSLFVSFSIIRNHSSAVSKDQGPPTYRCKIVHTYPHDPKAFTQGLAYHDNFLYESTGHWGQSSIRKVDLATGQVLKNHPLDDRYFGEGITFWQDKLIQLTWKEQIGFVYDLESFQPIGNFSCSTEGWGLTQDGQRLIMSDGTSTLHFLDPVTFERIGQLQVMNGSFPVAYLNELEYVKGEIYANVWQTNRIARISPETGIVTGWIDLTPVINLMGRSTIDFPNGIAYDEAQDRLFVTGKYWPRLFEIQLTR